MRRAGAWVALVAVLELITRAVVYGMAPSANQRAIALGHQLGGPGFTAVLLVAVGLAALLSVGLVGLAAFGVRERWELAEQRPTGPRPRVDVRRLAARATVLSLVGWLVFAGVESVVHLRAGMGFHGLQCLVGPVHRNALPVVAALAILASALHAVAGLVLAWMRRTMARVLGPRARASRERLLTFPTARGIGRSAPLMTCAAPRGPPLPVA